MRTVTAAPTPVTVRQLEISLTAATGLVVWVGRTHRMDTCTGAPRYSPGVFIM